MIEQKPLKHERMHRKEHIREAEPKGSKTPQGTILSVQPKTSKTLGVRRLLPALQEDAKLQFGEGAVTMVNDRLRPSLSSLFMGICLSVHSDDFTFRINRQILQLLWSSITEHFYRKASAKTTTSEASLISSGKHVKCVFCCLRTSEIAFPPPWTSSLCAQVKTYLQIMWTALGF